MHSTIPVPPPLRSEDEIVASWRTMGKLVVSIYCATYNHALYIKDELHGFLPVTLIPPTGLILQVSYTLLMGGCFLMGDVI